MCARAKGLFQYPVLCLVGLPLSVILLSFRPLTSRRPFGIMCFQVGGRDYIRYPMTPHEYMVVPKHVARLVSSFQPTAEIKAVCQPKTDLSPTLAHHGLGRLLLSRRRWPCLACFEAEHPGEISSRRSGATTSTKPAKERGSDQEGFYTQTEETIKRCL